MCIVGGGPSGLATAIRMRQLANEAGLDEEFRICVIEKVSPLQLFFQKILPNLTFLNSGRKYWRPYSIWCLFGDEGFG